MSSSKLVRHPLPHPTESLPGYVLRLSEINGYTAPRSLFRLADFKANETSVSNFNCSKLASISDVPISVLEKIAITCPESDPHSLRLLGNRLSSDDLNLTRARVCPECVTERGFIEAHWHIELMVACPVHERSAVWFCGKCQSQLSWLRSGLLRCKCGDSLAHSSRASYSEEELCLLDLIRQKALNEPLPSRRDPRMPVNQLETLNLQELLSIVRFLGNQRIRASGINKPQFSAQILRAATKVLLDWPANFGTLLRDIYPHAPARQPTAHMQDLANVYQVISERYGSRLSEQKLYRVGV